MTMVSRQGAQAKVSSFKSLDYKLSGTELRQDHANISRLQALVILVSIRANDRPNRESQYVAVMSFVGNQMKQFLETGSAGKTVTALILLSATLPLLLNVSGSFAADKVRMAYVSPSVSLSLPWLAKESGILSKYDLIGEVLLITGSPRLVQSLIAGDVDVAFAGITAITRARVRGAEIAILGAAANVSSQKLMVGRNSKIRRLEDLKGAIIGVSQYGSEADTFARNALALDGLKPDKDVTILQLGGHPQVAAAMVAGKLDVGALAGLAPLTAR